MKKAPIALRKLEGKRSCRRFWMCDQFDYSIFAQSDMTTGYVLKDNRAWDYSLKSKGPGVS
jgi:hypothetical protein